MELWDVYDDKRNKTGRTVVRGQKMDAGDYHLVVDMIYMNDQGELLVQKRAHEKEVYPDKWMFTGGSALAGEDSFSACARETREELGFEIEKERARQLFSFSSPERHTLYDVYLIEKNIPRDQLRLQNEEVQDARWVLPEELLRDPVLRADAAAATFFDRVIGDLSRLSGEKRVKTGRYRHFKGREYIVLGVAVHSETLEPMVVYQAQYGNHGVWVRPLSMWNERVIRENVDAPRFSFIGPA